MELCVDVVSQMINFTKVWVMIVNFIAITYFTQDC